MDENETQKEPSNEGATTPPNASHFPASPTKEHQNTEAGGTTSPPFAPHAEQEPPVVEPARTIPESKERTPNHTVPVKFAVRMFEKAGVPRTERSMTKWCKASRYDNPSETRLDCFYDERVHRYFITTASIERTIQEEKEKSNPLAFFEQGSAFGTEPHARVASAEPDAKQPDSRPRFAEDSQSEDQPKANSTAYAEKFAELERELRNLKIANEAKDGVIDHLKEQSKSISAHFAEQMTEQARALSVSFKEDVKRLGRLEERLQIEERVGERIINANHVNPNDA